MARRRGRTIDGVLLLDKPAGMSSNQALQRARRHLDARKAGHAGTLDPFATGLLLCCLGQATKLAGRLLDADKTYLARLKLGQETDSGDLTGQITASAGQQSLPDEAGINNALAAFRGHIEQIPPMTSALKHKGQPLYKYARKGIEIERAARQVNIYRLELIRLQGDSAELLVRCSKGTYIRTLAQDIGRRLGCYAHLTALRRTSVGPFHLDQAIALQDLLQLEQPESVLLRMNELPSFLLSGDGLPDRASMSASN